MGIDFDFPGLTKKRKLPTDEDSDVQKSTKETKKALKTEAERVLQQCDTSAVEEPAPKKIKTDTVKSHQSNKLSKGGKSKKSAVKDTKKISQKVIISKAKPMKVMKG